MTRSSRRPTKKAAAQPRSPLSIPQAFLDDMHAMNVQDPDVRPRATEEIPEMIQLIQELIDGGHAYEVEGDVVLQRAQLR